MSTEIGAFEAKTKFSELLRKVDQGESFTITVRGKAVANLRPVLNEAENPSTLKYTEAQRQAAFERLRNPRIAGISAEEIRAAIEEGRH